MVETGSESRSIGLVQKCGGNGVVSPDHCATLVRTSLIFMMKVFFPVLEIVEISVGCPRHAQERKTRAGQLHIHMYRSILWSNPPRRVEQLELAGGLQLCVLLGRRVLRRSHLFPHRVGVAVMIVDAVMLQQHARC